MLKVLMIILEKDSATGICTLNVAKDLIQRGYKVDILTYGNEKEIDLDDGDIRYFVIRPKLALALRERKFKIEWINKIISQLYKIQVAVTSLFMWPWNSPFFTIRLYRKIVKLYNKNKYIAIIPVYTQIDSLIAASLLKKKNKNMIYIPYFLDSLSGGPTPKLLTEKTKIKKGLAWEEKLLRDAKGVVIMKSAESHHEKYSISKSYYSKMKILDIPMFTSREKNTDKYTKERQKLVVSYIGSLPLSIRNPYYGLKMLSTMDGIEIRIIGKMPDSLEFHEFCKKRNIALVGEIPHSEVENYILESDILINFGNKVVEMVPSKIFEYMSFHKPILSFTSLRNEPSIPYLEKYPKACIIYENDEIENNYKKIEKFFKEYSQLVVSNEQLEKIFYLNMPKAFGDYLDTVLGE